MKKALTFVAIAVLGGSASAIDLYSQLPHTPGASGADGLSAFQGDLGSGMIDRDVADDFSVTGLGWNVNQVRSSWVQFTNGDATPITNVTVEFYEATTTVGALVQAATGVTWGVSDGPGTYFGRTEKILTVDFDQVTLNPGDYFVHIQPVVDHNWFWLTSDPTTPVQGLVSHFRRGPNTGAGVDTAWPSDWTPTPGNGIFSGAHDVNFVVAGQPVPEPASMIALGLGAAALAARRRRKKV